MTLTQITFFFFIILFVIVLAMLVHSYLDKRKIAKGLHLLTKRFQGKVTQESRLLYPRFHTERNGRKFDLFFNEVKVGRNNILYSIYSISTSLPHSLLFIKKDTYKAIKDEAMFNKENGDILEYTELPFQGHSLRPEWAERACRQAGIKELLVSLDTFSSLQLGPDALIVGKPYEGVSDTDPDTVARSVRTLEQLAKGLEQCPG